METNKVNKTLTSAAISAVAVLCQTSLLYALWRFAYNFYPDTKLFSGLCLVLMGFFLAGIVLFFALKYRDKEMLLLPTLISFLVWVLAAVPFLPHYFSVAAVHAKVNGVSSKEYFSFGFADRLVVFAVKLNSTTRELTLKIFNDGSSWIHLNVTGEALSCMNVPAEMIKVLASKSEIWIPPHGEKTVRLYIYTEQDANCTIGVSLTPLS